MELKITDRIGEKISPELIGLFFEDINFAADGGLYAEMIENRSFEAQDAFGTPGMFYTKEDWGYAWSAYKAGGVAPELEYVTGDPLSEVNPHYLRLTCNVAGQGFKNKAYDGITFKKGQKYNVSLYARDVAYDGQCINVKVEKDGKSFGDAFIDIVPAAPYVPFTDVKVKLGWEDKDFKAAVKQAKENNDGKHLRQNSWKKYTAVITALDDVRGADFVITLDGTGTIDFDLISMIPDDAVAGIFRRDLFEALKAIKPGFIRFPGGCIVEGISLMNRYQWKNTVGPLKDRKYIPNLWAFDDDRSKAVNGLKVQRPDSHYGQSYGIGFYEFFLLCELLGAKALPIVSVGVACQFRSTQLVSVDSPEFQEYIDDALDLIEFCNGPKDSKWGALRVSMGHEKPFNLTMIGVGNEQWETIHLDFYERATRFEAAIHEKYPDIKVIGSAGPMVEGPMAKDAWKYYYKAWKKNNNSCYAVDEHYYVSPEWMYDHVDMYDEYPRTLGVFAGEYAAHTVKRENNLEAALSEAALLTGIERNADVVKLASYAPLFNRIGHGQWKPDMIWFDDKDVYLTPNYYVQKLFGTNMGDTIIPLDGQEKKLREKKVYVSAVRKKKGEVIIKVVNASSKEKTLKLVDDNDNSICKKAKIQVLQTTNETPENMPEVTEIVETKMDFAGEITLSPKTFTVIKLKQDEEKNM